MIKLFPEYYGSVSGVEKVISSSELQHTTINVYRAFTLFNFFDCNPRFTPDEGLPPDNLPGLTWDVVASVLLSVMLLPLDPNTVSHPPVSLVSPSNVNGEEAIKYLSTYYLCSKLGAELIRKEKTSEFLSEMKIVDDGGLLDTTIWKDRNASAEEQELMSISHDNYLTKIKSMDKKKSLSKGSIENQKRISDLIQKYPLAKLFAGNGRNDTSLEVPVLSILSMMSSSSFENRFLIASAFHNAVNDLFLPSVVRFEFGLPLLGSLTKFAASAEGRSRLSHLSVPRGPIDRSAAKETVRRGLMEAYSLYLDANQERWHANIKFSENEEGHKAVHIRKENGFLCLRTQRIIQSPMVSIVAILCESENHPNWVPGAIETIEHGRIGRTTILFEQVSRLAVLPKRRIGCIGLGNDDCAGRSGSMVITTMPFAVGTTHVNGVNYFPVGSCAQQGDPTCFVLSPAGDNTCMMEIYTCLTIGPVAQSSAFAWLVDPIVHKQVNMMFDKIVNQAAAVNADPKNVYYKAVREKKLFYNFVKERQFAAIENLSRYIIATGNSCLCVGTPDNNRRTKITSISPAKAHMALPAANSNNVNTRTSLPFVDTSSRKRVLFGGVSSGHAAEENSLASIHIEEENILREEIINSRRSFFHRVSTDYKQSAFSTRTRSHADSNPTSPLLPHRSCPASFTNASSAQDEEDSSQTLSIEPLSKEFVETRSTKLMQDIMHEVYLSAEANFENSTSILSCVPDELLAAYLLDGDLEKLDDQVQSDGSLPAWIDDCVSVMRMLTSNGALKQPPVIDQQQQPSNYCCEDDNDQCLEGCEIPNQIDDFSRKALHEESDKSLVNNV